MLASEEHFHSTPQSAAELAGPADVTLRIAELSLDIGPRRDSEFDDATTALETAKIQLRQANSDLSDAEDADVTWRLHSVLKCRLPDEGATRIYERVDRPLIPVVAQMERHGIRVVLAEQGQPADTAVARRA